MVGRASVCTLLAAAGGGLGGMLWSMATTRRDGSRSVSWGVLLKGGLAKYNSCLYMGAHIRGPQFLWPLPAALESIGLA